MYGIEVVILIWISLTSYRVSHFDADVNDDVALQEVDLLESKMDMAHFRMSVYK